MSLFGGLMGDFDEDPFFGGQMRRMNNMMNSMMSDFFGNSMFGGGMLGGSPLMPLPPAFMGMPPRSSPRMRGGELVAWDGNIGARDIDNSLLPMGIGGFPNMRGVFGANPGNCHSYSSSTVMTMSSGPDGRSQVYQASTSTRQAPGGLRETKKSVADSRTGVKKLSIGHHIGERAHVIEREQNMYQGTQEEHQEFINLEEEEAETFNEEWEQRSGGSQQPAIGYGGRHKSITGRRAPSPHQLALPAPTTSHPPSSQHHNSSWNGSRFKNRHNRRVPALATSLNDHNHSRITRVSSSPPLPPKSMRKGGKRSVESRDLPTSVKKRKHDDEVTEIEEEEKEDEKQLYVPPIVLDLTESEEEKD